MRRSTSRAFQMRIKVSRRNSSSHSLRSTPPHGERQLTAKSVCSRFANVKSFLRWLDQNSYGRLDELELADINKYQMAIASERRGSDGYRHARLAGVRLFYLYRADLQTDRLRFDPQRIEGWAAPSRRSTGENKTARIPEQILIPLVTWASRWVEDFSQDVLNARDEFLEQRYRSPGWLTGQRNTSEGVECLQRLLARYKDDARPLPAIGKTFGDKWLGYLNRKHLAREAGCSLTVVNMIATTQIQQAVDELGIDDDTYLWLKPQGCIDGEAWLPKIPFWETPHLVELLKAACYVLVAFYSGMRDSEIKHLRRSSLSSLTDSTGEVTRRRITSLAFKGESSPAGVPASWVIGMPAVKAIEILERILPPDQEFLFATSKIGLTTGHVTKVDATSYTNVALNRFADWIREYCAERCPDEGFPIGSTGEWRLTTRQFRRTLAWFIARRPGGSITGAIQFRHLSIQMFEGYAGTSDSGFRPEIEGEEALERGEYLLGAAEQHELKGLSGPAAGEAAVRLQSFKEHARYAGVVAESPRQLLRLLNTDDPHVYPGTFVTCVFDPNRAQCIRRDSSSPDFGTCDPMSCNNVALTKDNREQWATLIAEIDKHLADGAVTPYWTEQLSLRRQHIVGLLEGEKEDHSDHS